METNVLNFIVLALLVLVLLISSYTDLKSRKIYNVVTITAIAVIVVIRIFHHPQGIVSYLWGMLPALIFFIAAFISKGKAIGGGDILLILFLGLTIGVIGTAMTILYSMVLAVLFSLIYYVVTNRKFTAMPMAVFLTAGVLLFYCQPYWLVPIIG